MRGSFWIRLGIILLMSLLFFLAARASSLLAYPQLVAIVLLVVGFVWYLLALFVHATTLPVTITTIATLIFCSYALFGWAVGKSTVAMAFDPQRITVVEGTLVEDSLLCKGGKQLLRVNLLSCATKDGAQGSAKGILNALVEVDEVLVSGSHLLLQGEVAPDGSLFFARSLQLLSLSRYRIFRRAVLTNLEHRLYTVMYDEQARALAMMLLLGRSSDAAFSLKELSLASGCAHLLALSGMHLQFFIGLLSSLFVPLLGGRRGRVVSLLFALIYVLLVGPKPSLVRAMGMAICSLFLSGKMAPFYSYFVTACLQVFLFPQAITSMGTLFSYTAYAGLLCNSLFKWYRPPILEPFFASLYAILFTAIPTLVVWGSWQIGGLFIAPVASPLLFALMGSSLVVLILGPVVAPTVELLHRMLYAVFSYGSSLFGGGVSPRGFLLYLFAVLTLLASIGYAERAVRNKRRLSYELEIRLRFTESY